MPQEVHKHNIAAGCGSEFTLRLRSDAQLLSFQVQHDELKLWTLGSQGWDANQERKFILLMTGQPRDYVQADLRFIGTALLNDGDFVVHLFEVVRRTEFFKAREAAVEVQS